MVTRYRRNLVKGHTVCIKTPQTLLLPFYGWGIWSALGQGLKSTTKVYTQIFCLKVQWVSNIKVHKIRLVILLQMQVLIFQVKCAFDFLFLTLSQAMQMLIRFRTLSTKSLPKGSWMLRYWKSNTSRLACCNIKNHYKGSNWVLIFFFLL